MSEQNKKRKVMFMLLYMYRLGGVYGKDRYAEITPIQVEEKKSLYVSSGIYFPHGLKQWKKCNLDKIIDNCMVSESMDPALYLDKLVAARQSEIEKLKIQYERDLNYLTEEYEIAVTAAKSGEYRLLSDDD